MSNRSPSARAEGVGGDATLEGSAVPTPASDSSKGRAAVVLERGDQIGRYVVLSRIGEGGMGVVYAAYDPQLDRKVAVKLLRHRVNGEAVSSRGRSRLLREARAMGQLSHPNVIAIHDAGTHDSEVFLAMEFVEGLTLAQWLLQAPRRWTEIREIFVQAGQGLAAAHAAGMVHRDFKPENVMIAADGRPRVMDFGLARLRAEPETSPPDGVDLYAYARAENVQLTRAGAIMGTPAYMSPEQHLGLKTDARTDQFSFCVALYEALFHQRPFRGETSAALALAVADGKVVPPPRDTDVPPWLAAVVLRGLRSEPVDRYPDMPALLADLTHDPSTRRRRWLAVGGLLVVVGGGIGSALTANEPVVTACQGARARLDDVWDDARRSEVESALLGTGLSYAGETWTRVSENLDAYTRAWVEQRTEACEATVRKEQSDELLDLRMACLDERLRAVEAAVDVLAAANADVTANAVRVVTNLEPLEPCADTEALLSAVPPPHDPDVRAQVDAVRDELADVIALLDAGRYDDGVELGQALRERAVPLGYRPLQAEVAFQVGYGLHRQGRDQAAEPVLIEAAFDARATGFDRMAASAEVLLVSVVGRDPARAAEAELWAGHADADLERLGGGTKHGAFLLDTLGSVAYARGRYEEAAQRHRTAADHLEQMLGPAHPQVAFALNNAGAALFSQYRYTEAAREYGRALAIWRDAYGPRHPVVSTALSNLALVATRTGDHERAIELLREALAIKREALGPTHPSIASSLEGLSSALRRTGAFDEALAAAEQALEIEVAFHGPESAATAHARNLIGSLLVRLGRAEEAIAVHEQALDVSEGDSDLADSHDDLGRALTASGRPDDALEHHDKALAIRERSGGGLGIAYTLIGRGQAELEAGLVEAAVATCERALQLRTEGKAEATAIAEAQLHLARALAGADPGTPRVAELTRAARSTFGHRPGFDQERAWIAGLMP